MYYSNCRYIIVVEHDLSVLDYLSDYICCLYGMPGAYGVVTMPFSVREGERIEKNKASINSYLILENPQNVDVLVVVLVSESNLKVSVICICYF